MRHHILITETTGNSLIVDMKMHQQRIYEYIIILGVKHNSELVDSDLRMQTDELMVRSRMHYGNGIITCKIAKVKRRLNEIQPQICASVNKNMIYVHM